MKEKRKRKEKGGVARQLPQVCSPVHLTKGRCGLLFPVATGEETVGEQRAANREQAETERSGGGGKGGVENERIYEETEERINVRKNDM